MYKKKSGSGSSDGLMQDSATPSTPIAPSDISVSVSESKDTENSEEASTQQEEVDEAPAEQGTLNFGAEEERVQQEEPVVEK